MTVRVEFLPPESLEPTHVEFWGPQEELKILGEGLYALTAERQRALALGHSFPYTGGQMSAITQAWSSHDPTRMTEHTYQRKVPVDVAVAAGRGVMLMNAEVRVDRHSWGMARTSERAERQTVLGRLRNDLQPLVGRYIEPKEVILPGQE